MLGITRKQFIRHAVLPGLRPRIHDLFVSGFRHIPFFMALVYQAVRLLPAGHVYTNPANIGRFGMRHVIAEAANNLTLSTRNIDQIVLFATLLTGIVIVIVQICMLAFSLLVQPAMAAAIGTNFATTFLTNATNAPQDIAYMMLDLVFGVPGVFNSCVATAVNCVDIDNNLIARPTGGAAQDIFAAYGWPFPIHTGLHQMFRLYSIGLMVVGAFIALYFMTAVIAETSQTGTPFGKRFNKVWAPLRIVVAFGLLVPLGYGLNSAQYIVLYAAKFGSGFASNGWMLFNQEINSAGADANYFDANAENLVSRPNVPEIGRFLEFMFMARVCAEFEMINSVRSVDRNVAAAALPSPPFIRLQRPAGMALGDAGEESVLIPYAVRGAQSANNALPLIPAGGGGVPAFTGYQQLLDFANGSTQVTVRFGVRDPARYGGEPGYVDGRCGEIVLNLNDPRDGWTNPGNPPEPGPAFIQAYYLYAVQEIWYMTLTGGTPMTAFGFPTPLNYPRHAVCKHTALNDTRFCPASPEDTPSAFKTAVYEAYRSDLDALLDDPTTAPLGQIPVPHPASSAQTAPAASDGAIRAQANARAWVPVAGQRGWAAAGIWYNRVAELNGSVISAVLAAPSPTRWPKVLQTVFNEKQQQDRGVSEENKCSLRLASGLDVNFERPEDAELGRALCRVYRLWKTDDQAATTSTMSQGNIIFDGINALLGTDGLFNMRRNMFVHPLSQLVGIGRSLIESAIRNSVLAGAATVVGIPLKAIDSTSAQLAPAAISLLMMVATIGLTAGFILFYIVPFLPFIYFFFAVGGWIKAIFEAMMGAPLWALAHIRIDGHGLPGQAAVNGYYLIFEIFIRPILIVFGMLASITIFAALVATLNQVWDLVTANLGGFNAREAARGGPLATSINIMRGPIDEFFYTVTYAIIVYLMAMSSFKLIDLIPNNILRWMGQSVMTFTEQREDVGQGLVGTASVGAQQGISNIGGALSSSMQTAVK